jgi:hypothetical protein
MQTRRAIQRLTLREPRPKHTQNKYVKNKRNKKQNTTRNWTKVSHAMRTCPVAEPQPGIYSVITHLLNKHLPCHVSLQTLNKGSPAALKQTWPCRLEPRIPSSVGRCLIHCATRPLYIFLGLHQYIHVYIYIYLYIYMLHDQKPYNVGKLNRAS